MMAKRKNIGKILFGLLFLLVINNPISAGTSGKIAGKVIDAENGQPLPGVNVTLVGTSMGASTDADGNYVILNVPPGKYTVKFSMVGYADYIVENIQVVIDLTTRVNAKLKSAVIQGKEVIVVAKKPIVRKDVSNSQMNIEADVIESLPVKNINSVLTLQAGIESGRDGIIVRGGGANQTVFLVDGLTQNDERSNIPYAAVSLSAIKEVQIQTGGFNAEYGNLRSGLVNVITKEGPASKYTATINIHYSPAAPKHFGNSIYDKYSYFNRPYMDPAVMWTGTHNGAWDNYTQQQYPSFDGWNAVSEATLKDDDPTNDLTPAAAMRIYEWQHRRTGDITKPDYVVDFGFGGPMPMVYKYLGNLRFYLSYYRERNMFVFPLSRDSYQESQFRGKFNSDISKSIKLIVSGLYGEIHSVCPYNWNIPTGRVLKGVYEVASLLNSSSGNAMLYMPGYFSPSSIFRSMFGVKLTHVISPLMYYDVKFQYLVNRYKTFQTELRDTTKRYQPFEGYFADEAPFGYWGYSVSGIDGMIMGGWMNLGRDRSVNSTTSFRFDLTAQINHTNQLKTGIEFVYNDYNINAGTYSPSMNTWTRSQVYRLFPFRFSAYAQDKMEFEGFIMNLGLRAELSDPNADWYKLSSYDKYFSAGYGNLIDTQVPREKVGGKWYFSPRLGVSHPITENSKLYFNYGHFLSEPASSYRFRVQRESNGLVTYLGNPTMELEKTVAYELGYSQNLFNIFLLNIAAYYKDVTNQPGWIYYQNLNSSVHYYKASNNNYADIRGFEITLTKIRGRFVRGFVNYTYDVVTSGYFGLLKYYEDPVQQREYLKLNPYQSRPHPRPYARANIEFFTPDKFGPKVASFYPFSKWTLNILFDWKTGAYTTFNPHNIPGVVDNVQWRDWYNINMRISKDVKISGFNFRFYLDVTNVLNTKHLSSAGFSDVYDYNAYLESLNFPWEEGVEHGNDKIGDYRPDDVPYDPLEPNPNNDPAIKARNDRRKATKSYIDMPNIKALTFLNPRRISFGIKIDF